MKLLIIMIFLFGTVNAATINKIINSEKTYTIDCASILWNGGSLQVKMTESNSSINIIFKTSKIQNPLRNSILISKDNSKPILLDEASAECLYKIISNSKIRRKAFEEFILYMKDNTKEALDFALVYNFMARIFGFPVILELENNKAMTSVSEREKLLEDVISKYSSSLKIISD